MKELTQTEIDNVSGGFLCCTIIGAVIAGGIGVGASISNGNSTPEGILNGFVSSAGEFISAKIDFISGLFGGSEGGLGGWGNWGNWGR